MTKKNTSRTRNWVFVVYPESLPEGWRDIIDGWHVPYLISPIHDMDKNPDGTVKKPHHHVLLMFSGLKTYQQIVDLIKPLNGPIPIMCQSVKGMARYFAHIDNPEKHQYSVEDIIAGAGADLTELLKPSSGDRYEMIGEMIQFINDNQVMEFEEIVIYAMNNKSSTWFPLLCDNSAYIISSVINSKRNRYKEGYLLDGCNLINVETGEIASDKSFLYKNNKNDSEEE
ncbi:replication protein [Peptoniphilus sp. MSJ-1]|uniref:Replication protein n=1 Tax=Peptoniphilus ovalis TaxID=2841503 RepID=A0ABS6FJ28_9FIRM|nr:replication protein [Peptoniphilus ovalis]MBU5670197.1 replication protein [Peptoniphilus ovalis]